MAETVNPNLILQERFNLGVAHLGASRWADAEAVYLDILKKWPDVREAHFNYGVALRNQGKFAEALAVMRLIVKTWPAFAEAWNNLGGTLRDLNQSKEAVEAFHQAVTLRPEYTEAWNNLGMMFDDLKRPEQAIEAYRRVLALRPEVVETWNNLGNALRHTNQRPEAIEAFRRAVALRGDMAPIWNNLAGVLKEMGQLDESLACYDRAVTLQPDYPEAQGNRLCTIHYHSLYDAAAIFGEAQRWNNRFARPLAKEIPVHDNDPAPERRLRVGYVSADFCQHCQALFTMPLFSQHNHGQFEIFCYSNGLAPDGVTDRLRRHADVWRDISRTSDRAAVQLVREDRIDILVDLALHSAANRLLIFARKPAPIQVTWLGYPGTTGLDAIDYRLTDPWLDPLDSEELSQESGTAKRSVSSREVGRLLIWARRSRRPGHGRLRIRIAPLAVPSERDKDPRIGTKEPCYSERSVRLPDCYWCYDPCGVVAADNPDMPRTGPLPALSAGFVTFGCLHNFWKVTDQTLELWAGVLAALPRAQLLLVAPPGPPRERVVRKLGVTPERVRFVPYQLWRPYLETYPQIDLCLDTVPCNGGTTSMDALWMGVPVVTRVGPTVVGRAGSSLLHNLGLSELVAHSDEQFVKIAIDWAGDLDRLGKLRSTLRQRMERSPLMDRARFARNVEAAYRQMWRAWCAGRG